MSSRASVRLAWSLCGLSLLLFSAAVVLFASARLAPVPDSRGAHLPVGDLLPYVPFLAFYSAPYLLNLHISPYESRGYANHEPDRTRKLLLHRKEIRRLIGAVEREGQTLVPLELYFKRGKAKVALALGKGKKLHDKRDTERERDAAREIARAVRVR